MSVEDTKQAEIGEFEQRSQRLLLNLSLETAREELHTMVAQRRRMPGPGKLKIQRAGVLGE